MKKKKKKRFGIFVCLTFVLYSSMWGCWNVCIYVPFPWQFYNGGGELFFGEQRMKQVIVVVGVKRNL